MAHLVSLDEIDDSLRTHLNKSLRSSDICVVLPQSSRSVESGNVKNCVIKLNGYDPGINPDIFSPNWFGGVSVVKVPNDRAEMLLSTPTRRSQMLKALVDAIPSEMQETQLQVGPELTGDEQDRDTQTWLPGFDGPGCCVGLYSAMHNKSPETHENGMSRVHRDHYLVCKAGAGLAGQTFHARLTSALRGGASLDDALSEEGNPGAGALRRVASAAKRNRSRTLLLAAEALGFYNIDTLGDSASPITVPHRVAIPQIDVSYNTLLREDPEKHALGYTWKYAAGACDAAASQGALVSSNVAEGFIAFFNSSTGDRLMLKNDAFSCLPFSTPRILSNRDAVFKAADAHKQAHGCSKNAHPDHEWVSARFAWRSKDFGNHIDIEPPCIWGSHSSECFLSEWARELGVSRASSVRLQPELVAISAVEPGKLRVAGKYVVDGKNQAKK